MTFGPSGHVRGPPNQLCMTLETPKLLQEIQENPDTFSTNIVWESGSQKLQLFEKRVPTNP